MMQNNHGDTIYLPLNNRKGVYVSSSFPLFAPLPSQDTLFRSNIITEVMVKEAEAIINDQLRDLIMEVPNKALVSVTPCA
jgi:hypothetical protein